MQYHNTQNKIVALIAAGFVLSAIVPMSVAYAETIGSGQVETTDEQANTGEQSVKLKVIDGTQDIAALSFDVNVPLENITSLSFFQNIQNASAEFGVNVILGVDTDNDGNYESDDLGFHIGTPQDPAALGDDSFIEMDGTQGTSGWTQIDAYNVARWYTPNVAGDGYDTGCLYNNILSDFIAACTDNPSHRLNATDHVKVVRLLIGGSVNWQNVTAFVDDLELNGVALMAEEDEEVVSNTRNSGPPSAKASGLGIIFSCYYSGNNCDLISEIDEDELDWILNSNAIKHNPEVLQVFGQ